MADNINVTPGTGSTIAADDIGGVLHQRVKVVIGADGVNGGDVSSANPMPVILSSAATDGDPAPLKNVVIAGVDGTGLAQSIKVTAGGNLQATLTGANVVRLNDSTGAAITLGQQTAVASLPVVLTAAQLSTLTPLTSINVNNFPATQAVTGTFFQATQPVSGTMTANAGTNLNTSALNLETTQAAINTKTPALGQALMAASVPVAIASNQIVTVTQVDGQKATYSAAATGIVSAATAQDIFTITGSATKTIRVNRVTITAAQTTAAQANVLLVKRSTANTAGTSTVVTKVANDSLSPAASATVLAYTANPTAGTLVGAVRTRKVFIGTTTANSDEMISEFGTRNAQALVLRGTGEVFAVNLNGVTVTGGNFNVGIEWTEE